MVVKFFGKKSETFRHRGFLVEWDESAEKYIIKSFPSRNESVLCDTKLEAKTLIDQELR